MRFVAEPVCPSHKALVLSSGSRGIDVTSLVQQNSQVECFAIPVFTGKRAVELRGDSSTRIASLKRGEVAEQLTRGKALVDTYVHLLA